MHVLTTESKVFQSKLSPNDRSGMQLSSDVQLVATGGIWQLPAHFQSLPISEHQVYHFQNSVIWLSMRLTYVQLFTPDVQESQPHLNSWTQMKQERLFYQRVGLVTPLVHCDRRYHVVKSDKFLCWWHLSPTIYERVVVPTSMLQYSHTEVQSMVLAQTTAMVF